MCAGIYGYYAAFGCCCRGCARLSSPATTHRCCRNYLRMSLNSMPLSHQVIETHTMPRRKGAKKKTKDEHRPLLFETPDSPHRTSGAGGGYGHGVLEERMPRQPTEKATFMGEVRVRMLKNILVSSWLIFRGSVLAVRLGSVSSGGSMPTVVLSPCSPVAFSLSLFFSLFFFFFLFLHAFIASYLFCRHLVWIPSEFKCCQPNASARKLPAWPVSGMPGALGEIKSCNVVYIFFPCQH